MTPEQLLAKALQAVDSAELLLGRGDLEGAINRAYYAAFNAARAALVQVGALAEPTRTHGTVIALFGRHLVQTGRVGADHGRMLNRCHQLRNLADYDVGSIDGEKAAAAVQGAAALVSEIRVLLNSDARPTG